jgi:hypothetical protein
MDKTQSKRKSLHLHLRWSPQDEERLAKVMEVYNLNRSEAVRACVRLTADQIKIRELAK